MTLLPQSTYIYSIEGKDLYKNSLEIKKNKKFKAALDYSLEAIQIDIIAQSVYKKRKRESLFYQIKNKQYTNAVINVTFKYNVKEYNLITFKKKEYYVHIDSGIDNKSIKNIVFKNGIYKNDKDTIWAIEIGSETTLKNKELPEGFSVSKNKTIYLNSTGISNIANADKIREEIYENGFKVIYENETVEYVRFKRSSGSSRVGKCLFIDKKLYKDILEWSYMGLKFEETDEVDLAALEAYIALTTSSIIDLLKIEPKNILLIDDYESTFKDKVMVTEIETRTINDEGNEEKEVDRLKTEPKEIEITNNIWDGQSLLDSSLFKEKYEDKGMLLLRNRFFKSCCFNCNIQEFFRDNGITEVNQLNGKTSAKNIEDIKLITTPSSIKYLKFGTWEKYIEILDESFGVVKYEKPTHYFGGKMVQTHYQLLNTLQLNKNDVREFLKDSLDYIRLLKNDIRVFREHLHIKIGEDIEYGDINSTDEFMFTMLQLNNKFVNTDLFNKFRQDTIDSYVRNMKRGHILIHGNYSVLCGNGIEMLMATIRDKEHPMVFKGKSLLDKDEVWSKNFKYKSSLLGCRSPHVTMGNIWLPTNASEEKARIINRYFNSSRQIVHINSINNNVLERLSSADFDSDQLILTDNSMLICKAKLNYNRFLVPTSKVEATKVKRLNTPKEKSDLDIKTSKNLIGEIINCSQILNSKLWDMVNNDISIDDKFVQELYATISQLDVMSCIEIDKAKKEFSIDNSLELDDIRKKYVNGNKKPLFFRFISQDKGNKVKGNKYKKYDTTMDYLLETINREVRKIRQRYRKGENAITTFGELLSKDNNIKIRDADFRQAEKIIQECKDLKTSINSVWDSEVIDNTDKYIQTKELKDKYIEEISKLKVSSATIKKIIYNLNQESKKIKDGMEVKTELNRSARSLLSVLYKSHKENFITVFEDTKEKIETLELLRNGDSVREIITLYGIKYIIK